MCLLGIISPLIVTHGPERMSRGRWAGMVLAASSAGGIAGAPLTGLWLLPWLGIAKAYLTIAAVLAAVALPLALKCTRGWPRITAVFLALIVLALAVCMSIYGQPDNAVESCYSRLEVRRLGDTKILISDGMPQTALPLTLQPGEGFQNGYLLELALMRLPPPRKALVIGLGAGLAPRLLVAHGLQCRSVEVDPAVVRLARQEFAFDGPVTIADGRTFLRDTNGQFDLIFLDVCTSDSLPWHLFTVEALRLARRRLTPDGQLLIQFIGDDGSWSASLARTVDAVFGDSVMLAAGRHVGTIGPRWLLASHQGEFRLPPEAFFDGECPWEQITIEEPGKVLHDAHFAAEPAWAHTAAAWRRFFQRP